MQAKLLKFKIITLSCLLFLFICPQMLLAANLSNWDDELGKARTETGYSTVEQTPEEITGNIIKIVLGFVGVIFLVLVIYGGILWMTAQGNEEKITKARKIIINSTIGLAIILAAYAITHFIVIQLATASSYTK